MKRRELKIFWSSNGIWTNSGYASFSRDILCRMIEDGWNVGHLAWWGLDGHHVNIELGQFNKRFEGLKIKVYPKMDDTWGADALVAHGKDFGADVTFVMQDIWTLNPQHLQNVKNFIPYFPVDKSPIPTPVAQRLPFAYRLITFSQFGHDTLASSGYASNLILEGIDVTQFSPMDKNEAKKKLGIPSDIFLFGMVAANKENPPRKGFQEALLAFKRFSDKHPEARLYIKIQQHSPTGFPILQFARHLEIADKLIFPDPYNAVFKGGPSLISVDMNAFDVLLHPSQTEGFGLTPVEAMACGTPVIVADNSSQPELIIEGKTGWLAKCYEKRYTPDESFVWSADPNDLYKQMEKAYVAVKKDQKTISKDCRDHVVAKYNLDTIYKEKWAPFLERIQNELIPIDKTKKDASIKTS